MTSSPEQKAVLLHSAGPHLCALPLEHVIETMRPLPVESMLEAPACVRGLSIIRGISVPVVDLRVLLGVEAGIPARRWITLRVGARQVALAVDSVLDVRQVEYSRLNRLPPLLTRAKPEIAQSIAVLDEQLVLVLEVTRLLPEGAGLTDLLENGPGNGH